MGGRIENQRAEHKCAEDLPAHGKTFSDAWAAARNRSVKTRSTSSAPSTYAQVEGSPGEGPRLIGLLRAFWPLMIIFALAGYLLRAAWPVPALHPAQTGFLFLLLAGVLAVSVHRSERKLGLFLKGARGEEGVARVLGFLPATFQVFHGVVLARRGLTGGQPDIDHVVVGPSGVFAVETKNWSGRITLEQDEIRYDGRRPTRSPLEQILTAAQQLEQELTAACGTAVTVQPILCFASGRIEGGSTGSGGVAVCRRDELHTVLQDSVELPLPADLRQRVSAMLTERIRQARIDP